MGLGVFILQTFNGNVCVYLRGCKRTVPQHFLYASEICPRIQKMRRKRMPQLMRSDICGKSSGGKPLFHSALGFTRREAFAATAMEHRLFRITTAGNESVCRIPQSPQGIKRS